MQVAFREQPERYLANSPIRYLEDVQTPLLLIHGEQDAIVGVSQAEEMFRGLAQLGKPVEFVRYRKAGHGDDMFYGAAWSRALIWFDQFLLARVGADLSPVSALRRSKASWNAAVDCAVD
jgi:dipeptidyl aminopeptidase/acylaminoacyl peptidase